MTDDPAFAAGNRTVLGSHHFTEDAIITFARKFDPQRFHTDPVAARDSMFGALCASGWHTAAVWMQLNIAEIGRYHAETLEAGRPVPEFGPSPGIRDLRWLKPVYAGSTITYARVVRGVRNYVSRPHWSILDSTAEAFNEANEKVISFNSAVLVKLPGWDSEA